MTVTVKLFNWPGGSGAQAPVVVAESAALVAGATTTGTAGTAGTGALAGDSDPNSQTLSISALSGGTVGTALAGLRAPDVERRRLLQLRRRHHLSHQFGGDRQPPDRQLQLYGERHRRPIVDGDPHLHHRPRADDGGSHQCGDGGRSGVTGNVLTADSDADGDSITVSAISDTAHGAGTLGTALLGNYGSLTIASDGTYTYTPNASITAPTGSHPTDVFTATVSDGHGGTTTQTLTVTLDRAPTTVAATNAATAGGSGVTGNVLTADSDADGDSITVSAISDTAHGAGTLGTALLGNYGSLTIASDGTYTYTPNASITAPTGSHPTDVFTATVSDGHGGTTTQTLTVTLDRAPTTVAATNAATAGGSGVTGNVLTADSDADGDSITVSAISDTAHGAGTLGTALLGNYGSLTIASDGTYTYTPNASITAPTGSHPTDVFTATVSDGHGGTDHADPDCHARPRTHDGGGHQCGDGGRLGVTGNVPTADSDADGDSITVSAISDTAHGAGTLGTALLGNYGSLTIASNGAYTYTPNASITAPTGSHPTDVFTATVSDGHGGTTTQTLTVTLDRAPTTVAATNAAAVNGPAVTGNVLTADSDADGDTLAVSAISDTAHGAGTLGTALVGLYGTLTISANGAYSYTPNAHITVAGGTQLNDVFTATVSDGHGGTTTETVTIMLTAGPGTATLDLKGSNTTLADGTVFTTAI